MTDELVNRLRWAADNSNFCGEWNCNPDDLDSAADEITRLRTENKRLEEALEKVRAFVRDLEPYADQGHTLVPALREACEILEASAEVAADKGDDGDGKGRDKGEDAEKGEADIGKGGGGKDKGEDGDD
jgi:hypothetical protein